MTPMRLFLQTGDVLGTSSDESTFGYPILVPTMDSTELLAQNSLKLVIDPNSRITDFVTNEYFFCVVPGCGNDSIKNPEKSFFRFPEDQIRCHQWVLYCQKYTLNNGKDRLILSNNSAVCADHFKQDQFVKNTNTLLKRTAVPCVPEYLWQTNLPDKKTSGSLSCSEQSSPDNDILTDKHDNYYILCRLCAEPCTDFIFIFGETGLQMKLAEKINLCFPFEVKVTDSLPKQICKSCLHELNELYTMADMCSSVQYKLMDMFCCEEEISESDPDIDLEDLLCPLCDSGLMKMVNPKTSQQRTENTQVTNPLNSFKSCDTISKSEEILLDSVPMDLLNNQSLLWNSDLCSFSVTNNYSKSISVDSPHLPLTDIHNQRISYENIFSDDDQAAPGCESTSKLNVNNCSSDESSSDNDICLSCRICGFEFNEEEAFLQHSFDHSCRAFYQCVACISFSLDRTEFEKHILSHKEDKYKCDICLKEFSLSSSMDTHTCQPQKCEVCFQMFPNKYVYDNHLNSHVTSVYCKMCCKIFPNQEKFQKHKLYIHSICKKCYCCEECGKVFKSEASMKYHQRIHNDTANIKNFFCEWCKIHFSRQNHLLTHLSKFHYDSSRKIKCFTCILCKESFPDNNCTFEHLKNTHSIEDVSSQTFCFEINEVNRIFICEFCSRNYGDESSLHFHRENHSQESPYQCKFCNYKNKTHENHDEHIKSHSRDIPEEYKKDFLTLKSFLCEFCERYFIEYSKYKEHLSIHYGSTPYECRHCTLTFSTLTDAESHRSQYRRTIHRGSDDSLRPYSCHFCDKRFGIEDALIKHIRMHTGEKPFICEQCGKGFSQSSGLYTHQKVHSSERPYSCQWCPRTFKIKGDRDVHVRKHSGERPYKCEFCSKSFMTQHVYSQHRKIHTNERPYRCDVCSLAFRRSHVLTVHKRIHTGEKPHACSICGKRYRQKGDMLKHIRIQHSRAQITFSNE